MCELCKSNPFVDWHGLGPLDVGTAQGGASNGVSTGFNPALVNQLNSGVIWTKPTGGVAQTITFGFPTSAAFASGFGEAAGWSAFTATQKAAARQVMAIWDELIAATFVESTLTPNTADIKFSNTTTDIGYAHAYFPGRTATETTQNDRISGSVWLSPAYNSGINNLVTPTSGSYGFMAIMHEVGHSLGLDHGGNYNGGAPVYGNASTGWLYVEDSRQFTIMSYFNASATGANWGGRYAQTPMVYDIMAIQQMYGADYTTRAGNTVYGFNSTEGNSLYDFSTNTSPILTIWDGNGIDTIDVSGWASASIINLAAGSYSSVNGMTKNLAITYDVDIENATTGAGNDTITGNDLGNILTGNGGNDTILGAGGNDILGGGAGDDWLNGGAGADVMIGGIGNDTYRIDNIADTVDETTGGGTDTVRSSITFSLSDALHVLGQIENLTLVGAAAINGTGNALANTIIGNSASNILTGLAGADSLNGDLGTDTATYVVSLAGVSVNLHTGLGSGGDAEGDTLISIENLVGSALNDILIGSVGNNVLVGLAGDDWLNGGAGADVMIGGIGNDTYRIDNIADTVDETTGGGTDTVRSSITFSLSDALHVLGQIENLTLVGAAAINGTGNALANTIIGNSASNTLNGGAGADTLIGGLGNDILTGGADSDTFDFSSITDGADIVTDFVTGVDHVNLASLLVSLGLDGFDFSALVAQGNLIVETGNFATGLATNSAAILDSHFYIDADGAGANSAVLIATLEDTLLNTTDFLL